MKESEIKAIWSTEGKIAFIKIIMEVLKNSPVGKIHLLVNI